MKNKTFSKIVIASAILAGLWIVWGIIYPSGTWRYKMTVTVATPEGIKTGSAVREVAVQLVPQITPEMKPSITLAGEAVIVDLGERGILFALLKGYKMTDHAKVLPFYVFPSAAVPLEKDGLSFYSSLKAGPKEVEPQFYPMFVHFRDTKDPKTVESLIEMEECPGRHAWPEPLCVKANHFEAMFGKGVYLKSVTLEMTDEAVTLGRLETLLS
ncbi:MAG: hypothetical protein ACAH80_08040, partial [Alphaproteobacteria bacterium]